MLKNDKWIIEQAAQGMLTPFESSLIRQVGDRRVISYGLSSYGYDLRLSPHDFRVFRHIPGTIVDPKRFNPENLVPAELHEDEDGSTYFIIPGNSYGLGVSLERVQMPDNVTAICMGKSTLARCAIIANITPIEAGWAGHVTLEFSNGSCADCRIYTEGVVQLLFLEGEPCSTTYRDRGGKYQDQGHQVTLARV